MTQEKTTLESIAPTIEEAIQKGLSELGLSEDAVEVEVLDAGSRGLFGLGSRQARVRLTVKPQELKEAEKELPSAFMPLQPVAPDANQPPVEKPVIEADQAVQEEDEMLKVAHAVVSDLLEKMKINAQIAVHYIQPEDEKDEQMILVDIQGDDLSILIGRRSETLNALQYITGLIVNKQLGRMVPLTVDVQGYRARRARQLRQLARRMADQAIHTGRRQVLEPMPAYERRLLHLELRNHPQVVTESIGEEPNRKVTIKLKKSD